MISFIKKEKLEDAFKYAIENIEEPTPCCFNGVLILGVDSLGLGDTLLRINFIYEAIEYDCLVNSIVTKIFKEGHFIQSAVRQSNLTRQPPKGFFVCNYIQDEEI